MRFERRTSDSIHKCNDCGMEMTQDEWDHSEYNIYYSCFGVHICKNCKQKRDNGVSDSRSDKGRYELVDLMIDFLNKK